MQTIQPKIGEEVETLLEHYIKSYSTLPKDLRESFYFNAEEFVLKKVSSDLANKLINIDYWKLLKKKTTKEVVEFALALDKTIKGLRRQRENIGDDKIKSFYQGHIDDMIKTRQKLHENCAICITRSLLNVMQKDFEASRGEVKRMNKFAKCVRQVVDEFFKKFALVDLGSSIVEIQSIILKAVLRHLGGENWIKVLAKFQKEAIKTQILDLADLFAGMFSGSKEPVSYEGWKSLVDQELNK